jgi:putative transposase
MARHSRFVLPDVPHHVTQGGNHRERVFFEHGDESTYLSLLHFYARSHGVKVMAYCLMPNHVHLVVVPSNSEGLHRALRSVHSQYAQRVNRMRGRSGHLWQGRYFSSPLDSRYFLNAVRYVELNPVRAGLISRAEDYVWSSAPAHCGVRYDLLIEPASNVPLFANVTDWRHWLAEGIAAECIDTIRKCARRSLPCGSPEFVDQLQRAAGRELLYRRRGRPRRTTSSAIPS